MRKLFVYVLGIAVACCMSGCLDSLLNNEENDKSDSTPTPVPAKTLTINYDGNGSTSGTVPSAQTFIAGNSVILNDGSGLAKSGHQLTGWNTTADGRGINYSLGASVTFTSNITLYAVWSVVNCSITYDANGGTGSISSQSFASGNSVVLSDGSGFSKNGYQFIGWNTNSFATTAIYSAGQTVTLSLSTKLYAIWREANFVITYDANGGTGSISSQSFASGNSVVLSDGSGFSRAGYQLVGWSTSPSATATNYSAGQTATLSASVTLYAVWVTNLRALMTEAQFNTLTPHRNYYATAANAGYWGDVTEKSLFDYEYLEKAALKFPKFLGEGDKTTRLKELAAFFANTSHETTGGWGTDNYSDYSYTNTRYGYGYCYPREVGIYDASGVIQTTAASAYTDNTNTTYPPVSGQYYFGRGPIQTSWNYNYGILSEAYYGDKTKLLNNPDLILQDALLFWYAAIKFWMSPSGVKPSCHGSMIGNWDSETTVTVAKRNKNNLAMGFGLTVHFLWWNWNFLRILSCTQSCKPQSDRCAEV